MEFNVTPELFCIAMSHDEASLLFGLLQNEMGGRRRGAIKKMLGHLDLGTEGLTPLGKLYIALRDMVDSDKEA